MMLVEWPGSRRASGLMWVKQWLTAVTASATPVAMSSVTAAQRGSSRTVMKRNASRCMTATVSRAFVATTASVVFEGDSAATSATSEG